MIWLALLFTCAVGQASLPVRRRSGIRFLLGFPVGTAAVSLQLLLYNLAKIPWNRWTVITPWILFLGLHIYRHPPTLTRPKWQRPHWLELPGLIFGAVVLLAWVPYERLMPLNEWDAVMLWMFKGKAFYLDGSVAPYLARAHEFLGNAAYPLLIPLYATFLYIWSGGVADHAAKILSPCFFASLVAGFYHLVRRFGSRPVAVTFTGMLMGVYIIDFVAFHYAGYADTAVAACVLLGAGFLYAWFRDGEYSDFAMAVLFASVAAWTKNEGLFFLLGLGPVAAARLLLMRVWNWRFWVTLGALPGLAVMPWSVARSLYGVKRPGQLSGEIVRTNVSSYWPTLKALVEHAFAPSIFHWVFPLFLLAVLLHRKAGLDWRFLLLPGLVVWQIFGVALVYVTGPVSLQWMIGSSLDRVLSQIAPLAFLAAALVFAAYYDAAEKRLAQQQTRPVTRRRSGKAAR